MCAQRHVLLWMPVQCCSVNLNKALFLYNLLCTISSRSLSKQEEWHRMAHPRKLLKICMLFTRWFIHEWLCNLSWVCRVSLALKKQWIDTNVWVEISQIYCMCCDFKMLNLQKRSLLFLLSDFDPNLGMMAGITPLNPLMPGLGMVPAPVSQELSLIKEIIHCKSCTLFPPNPSKSYNRIIRPLFAHMI